MAYSLKMKKKENPTGTLLLVNLETVRDLLAFPIMEMGQEVKNKSTQWETDDRWLTLNTLKMKVKENPKLSLSQ